MTAPNDTVVSGTLNHDLAWLRHHLILLALVGVLTFSGIYGIESLISRHDHEAALRMEALAQTLVQQNQLLQQQTKVQIDALTQQNVALQQEVGSLATAIVTRDAQLIQNQNKVPNLSPDQLSAEWQKDIRNAGSIKPTLPSGYLVDQTAAVATVQALESVPVLQQDIADLEKSNSNLQSELNNDAAVLTLEKKSHFSDNQTNTALLTAKDAEIKDVKAQARKSKLKWFGIGFLLGLIGGHAAGL